jgi:tetratricopeptide (TPR) repeat protein
MNVPMSVLGSLRRPGTSPRLLVTGLFALGLLGGCRATPESDRSVEDLFGRGEYRAAYHLAAQRSGEFPDDAEAAALTERARVAYWLDRGRELVFADRLLEAKEIFVALESDGAAPELVEAWLDKCNRMLAVTRRSDAWKAELDGDYDGAAELYREAVALWPKDEFAADGLERIETLAAWRTERGREYYNNGIRDLRNRRMAESLRSFRAAVDLLAQDPSAMHRAEEVLRMQAEERLQLADQLLDEGLYHAAAAEYRYAKVLLDDVDGIDAKIASAELEVEVLGSLGEADRMLRHGQADDSIALLEELAERTVLQGAEVGVALDAAREVRLESLYETALELERDFHFPEAIEAYDFVLTEAGGFYKDAISRKRTLGSYVDLADELYTEYTDAADDEARLDALHKIELFWPTYRDVPERVAEFESAQAPS